MKPVASSELWSTEHIPCTDTHRE